MSGSRFLPHPLKDPAALNFVYSFLGLEDQYRALQVCEAWGAALGWRCRQECLEMLRVYSEATNHSGWWWDVRCPYDATTAQQSFRLSRAYTIFGALVRFRLLEQHSVVVHCVGTDDREGSTVEQVQQTFAPLLPLLEQKTEIVDLHIHLLGPNTCVPRSSAEASVDAGSSGINLSIGWDHGIYDDEMRSRIPAPSLVVCFNAGLWGYDSWEQTMRMMIRAGDMIVVTCYNHLEADDDEDVLLRCDAALSWPVERNPFASSIAVPSTHDGEILCENSFWIGVAGAAHKC